MTRPERDELLEAVTEDVVEHVLYDSFLQAQIIAQEVGRSPGRIFAYEDLANLLEETGLLDRASENLPGNESSPSGAAAAAGWSGPELAIMLAYAKRWVARAARAERVRRRPVAGARPALLLPGRVVERRRHLLAEHPLRTQLVCMLNANSVVNALGPTFVSQVVAERAVDVASVVRAYRIAVEVTGADPLWEAIEELESVGRGEQLELLGGIDALVEATARWYLTWAPGAPFEATIAAGRDGFERLAAVLPQLGTEERRRGRGETVARLTGQGVPVDVARRTPCAPSSSTHRASFGGGHDRALDRGRRARVLRDRGRAAAGLDGARAGPRAASTRMQRWALQAVREDAFKARCDLAECALRESPGAEPLVAVEHFLHDHAGQAARLDAFLRALAREGESDLAGLALAVRQLGTLVS